MVLFFAGQRLGTIEEDESDPPFFSGYFVPDETLSPLAQRAYDYLLFCTREFDMKDDSPAHLKFEKEKESLFPEFTFSEEWKLGEELDTAVIIDNPLLSKEGMIFWSVQ